MRPLERRQPVRPLLRLAALLLSGLSAYFLHGLARTYGYSPIPTSVGAPLAAALTLAGAVWGLVRADTLGPAYVLLAGGALGLLTGGLVFLVSPVTLLWLALHLLAVSCLWAAPLRERKEDPLPLRPAGPMQ